MIQCIPIYEIIIQQISFGIIRMKTKYDNSSSVMDSSKSSFPKSCFSSWWFHFCDFHPYLGKISNWTNIFHQLVLGCLINIGKTHDPLKGFETLRLGGRNLAPCVKVQMVGEGVPSCKFSVVSHMFTCLRRCYRFRCIICCTCICQCVYIRIYIYIGVALYRKGFLQILSGHQKSKHPRHP